MTSVNYIVVTKTTAAATATSATTTAEATATTTAATATTTAKLPYDRILQLSFNQFSGQEIINN